MTSFPNVRLKITLVTSSNNFVSWLFLLLIKLTKYRKSFGTKRFWQFLISINIFWRLYNLPTTTSDRYFFLVNYCTFLFCKIVFIASVAQVNLLMNNKVAGLADLLLPKTVSSLYQQQKTWNSLNLPCNWLQILHEL